MRETNPGAESQKIKESSFDGTNVMSRLHTVSNLRFKRLTQACQHKVIQSWNH
jgi:hypothetical protein